MTESQEKNPRPSAGAAGEEGGRPTGLDGQLTRDGGRYVLAAIVPAMVSLLSVSIFTRVFHPEAYGRYSLILAAVTMIAMVASGWIQQSVLRYTPKYRAAGEFDSFVAKVVVLLFVVAAVAAAAFAAVGLLLVTDGTSDYRRLIVPAAVMIMTEMFFLTANTMFQANLRSSRFMLYRVLSSVLRLGIALILVFYVRRDIVGLIVGAIVANLILAAPIKLDLGVRPLRQFRGVDKSMLKTFAVYGLPMIGWLLGGQMLGLADRFVIGALRDSAEVGIYSANYNLVNMGFALVTTPLLMAAHPLIMNAWEGGRRERVPEIIADFSRYHLWLAVPAVVTISVVSVDIVRVLLGADFRDGYRVIPLVLLGNAVWSLAMYGHKGLEILERTRTMLWMVIACALLNLGLNVIFVARYGYMGAAVTTLVSYALYPVLVYVVSKRYLAWRIRWGAAARTIMVGAVMAGAEVAVLRLLPDSEPLWRVIAAGLTGLTVYVVGMRLAGEFRR